MGTLQFAVENGHLVIQDGAYYCFLTGQETHQVMNLLMDYRTDIIVLSVVEQREAKQKKREVRSHKKPKMIQVDGQWVEAVEVAELEKEQNE